MKPRPATRRAPIGGQQNRPLALSRARHEAGGARPSFWPGKAAPLRPILRVSQPRGWRRGFMPYNILALSLRLDVASALERADARKCRGGSLQDRTRPAHSPPQTSAASAVSTVPRWPAQADVWRSKASGRGWTRLQRAHVSHTSLLPTALRPSSPIFRGDALHDARRSHLPWRNLVYLARHPRDLATAVPPHASVGRSSRVSSSAKSLEGVG